MSKSDIPRREIVFANGNRAAAVTSPPGSSAEGIATALAIPPPQTVILLVGGAGHLDPATRERLAPLFSRGIARAAADLKAAIIDGGTDAGVMALMGQGVADRGRATALIGVAPTGKVTYPGGPELGGVADTAALDPNHSHFVLVEAGEWGGETTTVIALAEAFKVPVVVILANGGDIARREVLLSVRKNWPVVVMKGSGRLADQIAELLEKPAPITNPELDEIISEGSIKLFAPTGTLEDLEHLLAAQVSNRELIKQAWQRFATYDHSAGHFQRHFKNLQFVILVLGVAGVLLAVVQKEIEPFAAHHLAAAAEFSREDYIYNVLRFALILVPIGTSVLLAISHRLRQGNKWAILRSSAEAVKREIYSYRTRAAKYGAQSLGDVLREDRFEESLENVTRRLMRTEVNRTSLLTYTGEPPAGIPGISSDDDGFSFLPPARYLELRVGNQLAYYQGKTVRLERQLRWLQVLILVAGGIGTLLAALSFELWITLTTALATAFTSYLAYQQTEQTLVQYNQTAADLENLQSWWTKLTPAERRNPQNIDRLVEFTEKALESEMIGWGQRMEDALEKLRAPDAKTEVQDETQTTRIAAEKKASGGGS